MNLPARITGLTKCLIMATLLTGLPSYAATIYSAGSTSANGQVGLNSNSPISYDNNRQFFYGNNVVNVSADQGSLWGRSRLGVDTGTIFGLNEHGSATARLTYDDLIFIDTNNPSSTASINVSANFFASSSSQLSSRDAGHSADVAGEVLGISGLADITVGLFGQSTIISDTNFSGLYATPTVSVPLNTFITLNMWLVSAAGIFVGPDTNASYFTDSMVKLAGLTQGYTSFNLPDGISVVSTQGGFSEVGGASVVPVPAAVWLFGSALIGLAGVAKRRKS